MWGVNLFSYHLSTCDTCGGAVKVIASIDDPQLIKQILSHLDSLTLTLLFLLI